MHYIVEPFKIGKKIITLEECIQKSFINTKTKNSTLSLIRKYSKYCSQKLESELNDVEASLNPDNITNIFNPQNAYDFIFNS
jgi:wobble nucleotide-excising tRNase